MGELISIKKNYPILTLDNLQYIRENLDDPNTMNILYSHNNDPIQKILIEENCRQKGIILDQKDIA